MYSLEQKFVSVSVIKLMNIFIQSLEKLILLSTVVVILSL
jgi:hypothetical protein